MPTVEIPNKNLDDDDDDEVDTGGDSSPESKGPGECASPFVSDGSSECVICLDALNDEDSGSVAVLTKNGKRVCRHYFHMHCAQRIKAVDGKGYGEKVQMYYTDSAIKACPSCRSGFDGVKEVPDPKMKPLEWFTVVDFSQKDRMSKDEVLDGIIATIAIELPLLRSVLDEHWSAWDKDGKGVRQDMAATMLRTVRKRLPRNAEPPFLPENPMGWFDHWDEGCMGYLTKKQVASAVAHTLSSSEEEAKEVVDNIWCILTDSSSGVAGTISRKHFLEPRGLSDTLCASLAEDPRFRSRVQTALASPKSGGRASYDAAGKHVELKVGTRVRVKTEIGTPRYKWGRVRPRNIGTIRSIDRRANTCRVDFDKQQSWRGFIPELEKVPAYLDSYREWQPHEEAQIVRDLARAKKQQEDRSNWVTSMDATCGKVGKVILVLPAERKIKIQFSKGAFMYVMENVVRPGMPDPPKIEVGSKVRVKAEVTLPKYQWGSVSQGEVGTVTDTTESTLTCYVSFPRHHNWKGYSPELEVIEESPPEDATGLPENSPPGSPSSPRIRVGAYIRVKPSVTTPKFAWGRVTPGDVGMVTEMERRRELVKVDFPKQRNWMGYIHEMEIVRVRPPNSSWHCRECTLVNQADAASCGACDGPAPCFPDVE
ncbi:hypothetical protein DIPPA_17079 [Diplonema papillatum]|nr:hypothetical protein DIPPA_17079 [Diplonema papillatum]|eukprot:gene2243-3464_t